jgi:hypothetical protein
LLAAPGAVLPGQIGGLLEIEPGIDGGPVERAPGPFAAEDARGLDDWRYRGSTPILSKHGGNPRPRTAIFSAVGYILK